MNYVTHNVNQGDEAWHKLRAAHFTASDAAAMLGISKFKTRAELLRQKFTGITPEVDAATQRRFDDGHAFEAAARTIVEQEIGEDLFPIVVTAEIEGLPLLASLDGASMTGDLNWEHKTASVALVESLARGEIPAEYEPQMEQGLLITGAPACIFSISKGAPETLVSVTYKSKPAVRAALIAGWKQFQQDQAAFVPEPVKTAAIAAPQESLPAVSVRVDGALAVVSNLDLFGDALRAFIARIPEKPATDQDFADAEAACKTLKKAEDALTVAEESALGSLASVETMRRAVRDLRELARQTRLSKEKLVAAEKENRKADIVSKAAFEIGEHYATLNANLAVGVVLADPRPGIAAAIKGLKSLKSIEDAAAQVVANTKIAASAEAERHRANLAVMEKAGRPELFADRDALVRGKQTEDLCNLVAARITEADIREQQRLEAERERIRKEEEAKAKTKLDAEQKAEREKLAAAAQPAPAVTAEAPKESAASMQGQALPVTAPAAVVTPPAPSLVAAARPGAVIHQARPVKPSYDELVKIIATHYRVSESLAAAWLNELAMEKVA